jgi:hypothetical protein
MPVTPGRVLLLIGGVCAVFTATVVLLLNVMPGPRREIDYFVIGALATFASMALVFIILVGSWMKREDTFFRRRKE